MKKMLGLLALALCSIVARTSDLPVPDELVGAQTVGILHVDMAAIKFDQVVKSVSEKMGTPAPDPKDTEQFKQMMDAFKAAGGAGLSLVVNTNKDLNPDNAGDGAVLVVSKGENGDDAELTELVNGLVGPQKDKLAADCPKKVGSSLVWYSAKFTLPKGDEAKAKAFTDAFTHLGTGSSVSLVIVPDEDTMKLAEKGLKDAPPEQAAMAKALLAATAYCVSTNLGAAEAPNLSLLVAAADDDGAGTIKNALDNAFAMAKKEVPPLAAFVDSLKLSVAGSSVKLAIDLNELAKAAKAMMGP